MILLGREDEGRDLDLAEIDGGLLQRDAARLHQEILLIHLAQIEAVHGGGHARGIGIPVEQVEGEGLLAQQVVVDHEGPDQIIGPQHVEGRGHGAALEIALLLHARFEGFELLLVDEDAELARLGEIHQGGEEGRRGDAVDLLGRHIGQSGGEQRAAQAIADQIDLLLARGLLDGVQGGERPLDHVVLEALAGELLVGIDPGDHEDGLAFAHGPADEGVLLPEIQDVIFVDPGRHDEHRPLGDIGGRRLVLQQLDQIVLEDDLARGDRDVAADLEGVRIGHLDLELALAALEVVEQMLQPLHQILAAGLQGLAQDLRVGHDEIARRHGIDELARVEIDLLGRLGVEPVHVADGGLHPARAQQIGLLDEIEQLVLLPGRNR